MDSELRCVRTDVGWKKSKDHMKEDFKFQKKESEIVTRLFSITDQNDSIGSKLF